MNESVDFGRQKYFWCSASFRALADEGDGIMVCEVVSSRVVEEYAHQIADLEFGLLQFTHCAWTDALGRRVGNRIWAFGFLSISCPLTPGIRSYGGGMVATGDAVDSKKRQENQGFPSNPVKTKWGRSSVG